MKINKKYRRTLIISIPFGFWIAQTDQLNWSMERSSKSRQSEMALDRRRSPKALRKGEIMEATFCTAPMVVFTVPTNSDEGTSKHPELKRSAREVAATAVHTQRLSINMGFNSFWVNGGGGILELSIVLTVKERNTDSSLLLLIASVYVCI